MLKLLSALTISLAFMQGCVPIYCAISNARAPEAIPVEMFAWLPDAGVDPSYVEPKDWVELRTTNEEGRWHFFVRDTPSPMVTRPIVVDDHGVFIETGNRPDGPHMTLPVKFDASESAFRSAGVRVEFDEREYPRYLEVEAWLRAMVGYPQLPFRGKSAGRIIDDPYNRHACCGARIIVYEVTAEGEERVAIYELPDTDFPMWGRGVAVSDDGRFLYVYYDDLGALIPINRSATD